jgi:hypothetical protein
MPPNAMWESQAKEEDGMWAKILYEGDCCRASFTTSPTAQDQTVLPFEEEIRAKIVEIARPAPGRFQKIAEDFLSLRDPMRYGRLRPQGRNSADQTTKGYPDAYAVHGRYIDVVEVTVGDWRKHLENEDLKRLGSLKGARSYVLFVLRDADLLIPQSNAPDLKREKDEPYYRAELSAHGVPVENIEFIFLDQLVRELRSLRYAGLLRDLGLRSTLDAFTPVADYELPGRDAPRKDEFEAQKVAAPSRVRSALELLQQRKCLVVVGPGASGKTTLGLAAAHGWSKGGRDSYYADARELGETGAKSLALGLVQASNTAILLVIDNLHLLTLSEQHQLVKLALESSAARAIFLTRRELPASIRTLPIPTVEQLGTVELRTSQEDILAAYLLLSARENKFGSIQEPSAELLHEWLRAAPDLLIFSRALCAQKAKLRAGAMPSVTEGDALAYLHREYVEGLSASELNSLAIIAKLAELEIPASSKCLGGASPVSLIQSYKVIESYSQNRTARYSLPHDNLGTLIMRRIDSSLIEAQWTDALGRDPFQAAFAVRRLLDRSRTAEAREILLSVDGALWKFSEDVPPSFAHAFDQLYVRAGLIPSHRERVAELFAEYVQGGQRFLDGVSSFLRFCTNVGVDGKPVVQKLLASSEESFDAALRQASPYELTDLLRVTHPIYPELFDRLSRGLSRDDVLPSFANHFVQLSAEEANGTLVNLNFFVPTFRDKLKRVLVGSSELQKVLGPLPDTESVRRILRLKELIEFVADAFPELLLVKLRSFKVLRELTEKFESLGPSSRALLQTALAGLSPRATYRGEAKRDVDVFTQILTVASDERLLRTWLHETPHPLDRLMLFWSAETFAEMFESLSRRFSADSPSMRELWAAADVALAARMQSTKSPAKRASLAAAKATLAELSGSS